MSRTRSSTHGPLPSDAKTGPKGEAMTPLPSASLVVLYPPTSGSTNGDSSQSSTLVVQRSARDGSSFRSAVVFPGGALDIADVLAVTSSPPPEGQPPSVEALSDDDYDAALRLCALRETFEETGLLLMPVAAKGRSSSAAAADFPTTRAVDHDMAGFAKDEWATARDGIHNDARQFPPFLKRVFETLAKNEGGSATSGGASSASIKDIVSQMAPMRKHSRWITPRNVVRPAKRFDAHFFVTSVEPAHRPGVDALGALSADGTETLSLRLEPAGELIKMAMRDQIVLFPPQFYILADLAKALSRGGLAGVEPLIFSGHRSSSERKVTPVEEEARNLKGREYSWERTDTPPGLMSSSSSSSGISSVTSVEPRMLLGQGRQLPRAARSGASGEIERSDEDEPFVFPLVLPGDRLSSVAPPDVKRRAESEQPLNRVLVSPRSKKDGGGLVVQGAIRRGLAGLQDFTVGERIEEMIRDESEDDDEQGPSAKL